MPDLTAAEVVRLRPALYVGSTDRFGLQHLPALLLQSFYSSMSKGRSHRAWLSWRGGLVEGRVDGHLAEGGLDKAFDVATRWASVLAPRVEFPLFIPNALSASFELAMWEGEDARRARFRRGAADGPPQHLRVKDLDLKELPLDGHPIGTRILFRPDAAIFSETHACAPSVKGLEMRVGHFAALCPGTSWSFARDTGPERTFSYAHGLADLVSEVARNRGPLHPVVFFEAAHRGTRVKVAAQWCEAPGRTVLCFADLIHAPVGSHLDGFVEGFRLALHDAATRERRQDELPFYSAFALQEGLVAAIQLESPHLRWVGSMKERLESKELEYDVQTLAHEEFGKAFEARPQDAHAILDRVAAELAARCH